MVPQNKFNVVEEVNNINNMLVMNFLYGENEFKKKLISWNKSFQYFVTGYNLVKLVCTKCMISTKLHALCSVHMETHC